MSPLEVIAACGFALVLGDRWRWVLLLLVLAVWITPHLNLVYEAPVHPEAVHCNFGKVV